MLRTEFNLEMHQEMVSNLAKRAEIILGELTPKQVDLLHASIGISGEAGELLDAVKKHAIYQKPLDRENMIEELGDLEFYMEQCRQALNVDREEVLYRNFKKLLVRYPQGFTNEAAQARLDKVAESPKT